MIAGSSALRSFLGFAIPLAIFLTPLALGRLRSEHMLPPQVTPRPPPGCPEVQVEPACRGTQRLITGDSSAPPDLPRLHCSPASNSARDWYLQFKVAGKDLDRCGYALYLFDSIPGPIELNRHPSYARVPLSSGINLVDLPVAPERTYDAAVVYGPEGHREFASRLVLVSIRKNDGLNFRWEIVKGFLVPLFISTLLLLLIVRYRPGGPHGPTWRHPRWLAVVALAGLGGLIAGLLFDLRPPDFGGFNSPPRPLIRVALVVLIGLFLAVTGAVYDIYRRNLSTELSPWSWLLGVPVVIFIIASTAVMAVGFSATMRLAHGYPWLDYRIWHYAYFSLAVSVPLILHRDPAWLRQLYCGTGSVRPFQDQFPRLLGSSLFSSLLAALISVAVAQLCQWPLPGRDLSGFDRPLSIVGLSLSSLPIQVTLALALSLGEERPPWVQELGMALGRYLDNPDRATHAPLFRNILRLLIVHQGALLNQRYHLELAAHVLPAVLRELNDADRDQLASELRCSREHLETRLSLLSTQLMALAREPGAVATPLLLLRDGTHLQFGKIELSLIADPSAVVGLGLCVMRNRRLVRAGSSLHVTTRRVMDTVLALASPARDSCYANGAWRLQVSFSTDEGWFEGGFRGASFELPLALALWGLLCDQRPQWPRWLATGGLDPMSLGIGAPGGLAVKSLALDDERRILFTGSPLALTDEQARAAGVTLLRVTDDSIDAAMVAAKEIRKQLRAGHRLVVGTANLGQALFLLYGTRT